MSGLEFFGWGAAAGLAGAWAICAARSNAAAWGWLVGLAHLGVAALHGPALVQAIADPAAGYQFGVMRASGAWGGALAAAVLVVAAVGAFSALGAGRRAKTRTAAASLIFLVNLGGAWAHALAQGGLAGPEIGSALLLALLIAPFCLGTVWAGRRALSPA